jgi:hypothetical protein
MKSMFNEAENRARLEEEKKSGSSALPVVLWFVAAIFVGGVWGVYRFVDNRPALQPPPPPVSLADVKQTNEVFGRFNRLVEQENWTEAETMLSLSALDYLKSQGQNLRGSILGDRKNDRVVEAASTPSGEVTPDRVRQDCVYKFMDGQYKIIPLAVVIENGKIVISSWWEDPGTPKPADKPIDKPEGTRSI